MQPHIDSASLASNLGYFNKPRSIKRRKISVVGNNLSAPRLRIVALHDNGDNSSLKHAIMYRRSIENSNFMVGFCAAYEASSAAVLCRCVRGLQNHIAQI